MCRHFILSSNIQWSLVNLRQINEVMFSFGISVHIAITSHYFVSESPSKCQLSPSLSLSTQLKYPAPKIALKSLLAGCFGIVEWKLRPHTSWINIHPLQIMNCAEVLVEKQNLMICGDGIRLLEPLSVRSEPRQTSAKEVQIEGSSLYWLQRLIEPWQINSYLFDANTPARHRWIILSTHRLSHDILLQLKRQCELEGFHRWPLTKVRIPWALHQLFYTITPLFF